MTQFYTELGNEACELIGQKQNKFQEKDEMALAGYFFFKK